MITAHKQPLYLIFIYRIAETRIKMLKEKLDQTYGDFAEMRYF